MALDFPNTPIDGQVYDNFIYDASKGTWKSLSSGASPSLLVSPTITNAVITATATTASTVPITVNGAASQSANLQEWKNSAGIVLADVDSVGSLQAPKLGLGGAVPPTSPSSTNLQVNGRAKILSNGSESAGIWLTGSNNVDTAFIGQLSPNTTDPVGIYHNGDWRLTVDSLGRVRMPYQPAFSSYASSSSIAPNQFMPYNNAPLNRGGHFNTSTYRFTAPVAGVYLFSSYDIGATSGTTRFALNKNNVSLVQTQVHQLRANNGANYASATSFWLVNAAAGDFFSVYVYETGSYGTSEYSWFSGYLVG